MDGSYGDAMGVAEVRMTTHRHWIKRAWCKLFHNAFMSPRNGFCRDEQPTTDVVFALAAKLLGEELCYVPLQYPTFAHMKGAMLNMGSFDTWRNKMYVQSDGKDLLIGFNKQLYPVHYQDKEFATQELIKRYEDLWTTATKNS